MEPAIRHLKHDNGMDRCWLKGQTGDALHAVLCAAGYNIRWLLRAIVRLGLKGLWLRLSRSRSGPRSICTQALVFLCIAIALHQRVGLGDEFCRADYVGMASMSSDDRQSTAAFDNVTLTTP